MQSLDIAYLWRPRLAQQPATLIKTCVEQLSCASSQQVHAAPAAFRHTIRNCLMRCMAFPLLLHMEAANCLFACQTIAQASTSCKSIEADRGMQHCS